MLFLSNITILYIFYCFGDHTKKKKIPHMRSHKLQPNSLQNSLNGKTFNDDEAVKSHLVRFFVDKDQKFYERGIMLSKFESVKIY